MKTTSTLIRKFGRFFVDESGPTAVEYAIMLAIILVGCIAAVLSTGDVQQALFFDSAREMSDKIQP